MNIFSLFYLRAVVVLALITTQLATAQSWLPGYNYRKKITIDKSKVGGTSNLLDFPVLIAVEDAALKYMPGCGKISNAKGLDISFATAGQPAVALNFQLDTYDGSVGKLMCWVRMPELIAGMNTGLNEVYLYYGSSITHDPYSLSGLTTWSDNYQKVWHLNCDVLPSTSHSANHSSGNDARGISGMDISNFPPALIGSGVMLNGNTEAMYSAIDTNTTICITAWIKLNQLGNEQVIVANDSLNANGYRIKINSSGNLEIETINFSSARTTSAVYPLTVGTWYYIAVIFDKGLIKIYVNGTYRGGRNSAIFKTGQGGGISIGRSKQNDRYFNGIIDELRIQNIERAENWLVTEYVNQKDPAAFFTVSAEEANPAQAGSVNEFTAAAGTDDWTNAGNWSNEELPENYADITVKAGKTLRVEPGVNTIVNKLIVEPGAVLSLGSDLEINCLAGIGAGASVTVDDGVRLTFKQDVVNDGSIALNQNTGTLVFAGNNSLQTFSGAGTSTVSRLEIDQASANYTIQLQTPINITGQVKLINGILNSNGNLTLLSSSESNSASLLPVQNPDNANIVGEVNVQKYINGAFPDPSTARGWRLLTSSVYHSVTAGIKQYNLFNIKESVFVTGAGGSNNGFDPSPNNGATIYTHNQSLPGTLSQKYIAIQNMNVNVPLGKGIYLFSRGNRNAADAYINQIQNPPFSNPEAYIITYTGLLYTGNLTVDLFNKNTGAEGDGFNLLGNPYASAITWGGLQKSNVGPFIWVFDPVNSAYYVTDDPDFIVNSGAGFFVRVSSENTTGTLTFSETAKYTSAVPFSPRSLSNAQPRQRPANVSKQSRLKVQLSRNEFADHYEMILRDIGKDEVTDADAPKIGDGYLSIAGLTANGDRLSIDERASVTNGKEIKLYVKGWSGGGYKLSLTGLETLTNNSIVTLVDHYLNINKDITRSDGDYLFSIDTEINKTYGDTRFSLLFHLPDPPKTTDLVFNKNNISVYPNPFKEVIYLKSVNPAVRNVQVLIKNITGQIVWNNNIGTFEKDRELQIPSGQLMGGVYILQLIDTEKNQTIASFKVIKE